MAEARDGMVHLQADDAGPLSPVQARSLAAQLYRCAKLAEGRRPCRPTVEDLRSQLHYEPATGKFTWLVKSARNIIVGQIAGTQMSSGYILIRVNGESYSAHRLAWYYVTGDWPAKRVDHKNRVRNDNRWNNLRLATASQNIANSTIRSDNTTGLKGVFRAQCGKRWVAQFRKQYLGTFRTAAAANEVYMAEASKFYGEYAYDGVS